MGGLPKLPEEIERELGKHNKDTEKFNVLDKYYASARIEDRAVISLYAAELYREVGSSGHMDFHPANLSDLEKIEQLPVVQDAKKYHMRI